MPADFSSYKIATSEKPASSSKMDAYIQAVEDSLNKIGDVSKMGWATGQIIDLSQLTQSSAAVGALPIWGGSAWAAGYLSNANFASNAGLAVTKLAAGTDGQVLRTTGTTVAWGTAPGASLTTVSNALGADVALTSANTAYDGPSISCVAGTWLLSATITLLSGANTGSFTAKLWDGATVASSTEQNQPQNNRTISLSLAAIVAPGSTTTYKISALFTTTGSMIKAAVPDNAAGLTASVLVGVKVG